MSAKNDNPVGRLHNILSKIVKSNSLSPYRVFEEIFKIDYNDSSKVLESYSQLFKLCSDCKTQINNIKKADSSKLCAPIDKVILALSTIHFNADDMTSFCSYINSDLLGQLDLCSELLSVSFGEHILETDELLTLKEELEELIDSVNNSNINTNLKSILLIKLTDLLSSIDKYTLFGLHDLKKSIEASTGSIILNNDLITTEEEHAQIKAIFAYMNKISDLASFSVVNSHILNYIKPKALPKSS